MQLKIIAFFLFIGLFLCLSQYSQPVQDTRVEETYRKAEKYFSDGMGRSALSDDRLAQKKTEDALARAKIIFQDLTVSLKRIKNDSLLFFCYFRLGLIEHYFDHIIEAKKNYLAALHLKEVTKKINDSCFFRPYLYAASIYYLQNQMDSAKLFYTKAEAIQETYKTKLTEGQRLYNGLGVLYYESGNYNQSYNYFTKAINTLKPTEPGYKDLLVNYKVNIGVMLTKVERYQEALSVYESLRPYQVYKNEVSHNMAIIYLRIGKYQQAIETLKKVSYAKGTKQAAELFYNYGQIYNGLKMHNEAMDYMSKALVQTKIIYQGKRTTSLGLIYTFFADDCASRGKYDSSLRYYQSAIEQFYPAYTAHNIYDDPLVFSGLFSYINLFNALVAKAESFEKLYKANKNQINLQAALHTYTAAFKLIDYIEKTYESDEARLFLNKIKYKVHSQPIGVCLQLYQLTKDKNYLEKVYVLDQQNKASVLTLNLQQAGLHTSQGIFDSVFLQAQQTKQAITRLSLKAYAINDSMALQQAGEAIRDQEILLSRLQEKMNLSEKYAQLQPSDHIPSIISLQTKFLDASTAVISYHLNDTAIIATIISKNNFEVLPIQVDAAFFDHLNKAVKALHNLDAAIKFSGYAHTNYLYARLIKPLTPWITGLQRLIIIPDDELNYLPIEALQDENKNFLIEKYAVTYQFSSALLQVQNKVESPVPSLAFAPFNGQSINGFNQLPYSKNEVNEVAGKIYIDAAATKKTFMAEANLFSLIHLATHAAVNDTLTAQSYISFYPTTVAREDYNLYADEIATMNLSNVNLVILSACETGNGRLEKGEGVMSLSRAFAYAGCKNIITSLWQAEDKATAYLTQHLHTYLNRSFPKDIAMQKAKMDLLHDPDMQARYKTPNYWAHLVFIGNYTPQIHTNKMWLIIMAVLVAVLFLFLVRKKRVGN